jgi:hypothetical protein
MARAYIDLVHTMARAEQALSLLQPPYATRSIAFRVNVLGLACMVMVAREEIARAERFALVLMERRPTRFHIDRPS